MAGGALRQGPARGEALTGHWFDRSREYAARNQREDFEPLRYATEETVELSPVPCWAHLTPEPLSLPHREPGGVDRDRGGRGEEA
jgi:hypothetical protein